MSQSERAAVGRFSQVFCTFDPKYGVLVDEGNLLLSRTTVLRLQRAIERHLARSELELEAIAARLVQEHHPSMVGQIDMEYFK